MKRTATEALLWTVAVIAAFSMSVIAGQESYGKTNNQTAPHSRDYHQKGFSKT